MTTRTFRWFRQIAFAEGISFLVLLLIAMPLKYLAGMPLYVKYVGYAHGFLFVAFMILAIAVKSEYDRRFAWLVKAGLSSIIPFGTLWMEKFWKREEAEIASRAV